MNHRDGYIEVPHSKARGSSRLYCQSWSPDGEPRASILLVHGLGEHSGRYAYLARHCTSRGFAVHTLDHYGHGRSDGHPGYVERFSVFVDGVTRVLDTLIAEQPERPRILVGHSMGGLIAANLLLERQSDFCACVLSGPLLKSDTAPPAFVMALVRLIAAIAPTVPLLGLDPAGVSRDPEVVRAYVADPLVHHGKLSARLIAEMSRAMRTTLGNASGIRLPLLVMHGEDDVLTAAAGSVELHEKAASADKSIRLYPGLYHEIFNEPEKDAVLDDMTRWMEDHLP